jgi:hypothetical protein
MAIISEGQEPTHHLSLTDGTDEVGFVISTPVIGGEPDESLFRRFPFADPARPYATETQNDWSGGMANHVLEDNRTRYWKSRGVDTMKTGAIVLGPQWRYADGIRVADQEMPTGSFKWREVVGEFRFRAMKFTASANYTTSYIKFFVKKWGNPGALKIEIRNDSGGSPGSVLTSQTYSGGSRDGTFVKVSITQALTQGNTYWVVFDGESGGTKSYENRWLIGGKTGGDGKYSSNGTSWSAATETYYFRLCDADDPFIAQFYEYKKQLYAALRYDADKDSKIFMNGWRGACDSNTGELGKLKDSTQTGWITSDLWGCVARIVSGYASREMDDYRECTTAASGYVNVSPSWKVEHTSTADYVVLGSNKWFEITSPGSLGEIVDLEVAEGMAIYCMFQKPVWLHREYNKDGTWTADATDECWNSSFHLAHFAKLINDPISGPVVWFGHNWDIEDRYHPYVYRGELSDWGQKSLGACMIDTLETIWTSANENVIVTYGDPPDKRLVLQVIIGKVTAVNQTPTAGGSGYQVGDDLTIVEGSNSCTVNVDTIGGSGDVTQVTLLTGGYDYSTGAGKTTSGGSGTGCTIEITTTSSFNTGLLAYHNLTSAIDITGSNRLTLQILVFDQVMNAGDLEFLMDNNTNCASPLFEIGMPKMSMGSWYRHYDLEFDGANNDANDINSVGLQLTAAKAKTFRIILTRQIHAYYTYKPVSVGEDGDNITGLEVYGDPENIWVFTETGMGEVRNNTYLPKTLREMKVANHPNNGRAHDVHDVYLIFSWRGRLQRYYRQNLEDLGPDLPPGFGSVRGQIVDIQTYPGRIYVAVDGGDNHSSMVLCYRGGGWHEVYTSTIGERIRKIHIQAIPTKSDRLWVSVGGDLLWMPITLDAVDLPSDSDYLYRNEGYLETSWIYTTDVHLNKLFNEIQVITETSNTLHGVEVEYAIEDDTEFTYAGFLYPTTIVTDLALGKGTPPDNIHGKRIRVRFRLLTEYTPSSPTIRQTTFKMFKHPEVKFAYSFVSRLSTLSINLRGDEEKVAGTFDTVKEALDKLDEWAATMTPLYVKSEIDAIAGKVLKLEPLPAQLLLLVPDDNIEDMPIQVTLNEI